MGRIHPGTVLLAVSAVLIGGWAFTKLLEPANMLEMIRLFSMC
ncbi:MAG TPA: hypothetical protein VGO51_16475 [Burkholderiaceae bacterium]|jgi:hypothetical protein|nr:hypothetical protein [Burkholderiaceae bacterium]